MDDDDGDGELKAHIQQRERKREREDADEREAGMDGRTDGRGRRQLLAPSPSSEDDVGRSGLHKKCTRSSLAPSLTYAQTDSSLLLPSSLANGRTHTADGRTDRQTDTFPAGGRSSLPG